MQLLSYICIVKNSMTFNLRKTMKISGKNIGVMLKEARGIKQLTQEQLAQRVGKKRSYIARIETDYAKNIKLQTLLEIVEKGLDGEVKIDLILSKDQIAQ